jgi:tRNA pseudouridine55 synthase
MLEGSGIVLVNKPEGLSSQQVVSRVKRIFGVKKAGHTGSLDVMATGMLPVCLGSATKLCEYLLESDKTYLAELKLGEKTKSGDREGEVIQTAPVPLISESQLQSVMTSFLGKINQIPPMYSALKYQGKCLYELARKGIEVDRQPREISI